MQLEIDPSWIELLRSIIQHLILGKKWSETQDSGKKFNKTDGGEGRVENLAQPNLDGISCIISNIQFHLEKKPDKSSERVENFSLVSSLDPSSSSFQIFFLQRCLTPSRICFRDAFVFHFRSLLSFLTTIFLFFLLCLLLVSLLDFEVFSLADRKNFSRKFCQFAWTRIG